MKPSFFIAAIVLSGSIVSGFTATVRADETPASVPRGATEREKMMGKKAIEQLSKDPKFKLLQPDTPANKALLEKINAMAQKLGKVSARPDIEYRVSIVDDKDLNAFTLPGGHLYFNRGLLEIAGSDDEIAAVMAHEIGHNARMHVLRGEKKTKPLNWAALAATLAAFTGKAGADVAAITPYILTGIVSGYSVNYEKEADASAIPDLIECGYNPSALVTFMNRLADEEKRRPKIELGIYQTHPPSPERAAAALAEIKRLGLTYNPRAVEGATQAFVVSKDHATSVMWKSLELVSLRGENSPTRAAMTAKRINELMRAGLQLHEIVATEDAAGASLSARGIELVRIDAIEAKAHNLAPLALAKQWRANFNRLFWKQALAGTL